MEGLRPGEALEFVFVAERLHDSSALSWVGPLVDWNLARVLPTLRCGKSAARVLGGLLEMLPDLIERF